MDCEFAININLGIESSPILEKLKSARTLKLERCDDYEFAININLGIESSPILEKLKFARTLKLERCDNEDLANYTDDAHCRRDFLMTTAAFKIYKRPPYIVLGPFQNYLKMKHFDKMFDHGHWESRC